MRQPNIIIVFADQMRYQATGFGGDPNVSAPNLDRFAAQSLNFDNAISGCPVCCPARASLLSGMYPHQHGVFVNDVSISNQGLSLAEVAAASDYDTAYIGKWHLDGHGRSNFIPADRRHGFQTWQALECTHDYNHSKYYSGDITTPMIWEGYDAEAQTRAAQEYIKKHNSSKPFLLVLSWGPPHNPYETAPKHFHRMYEPSKMVLRPNVPEDLQEKARTELAGYYAHISALDALMGDLLATVDSSGIAEDTIFVFWSDHGDMLGSQGQWRKQRPWEESIHVPLLIRYPSRFGMQGRHIGAPLNTPDIMPTILGLSGLPVPATVTGNDYSAYLLGDAKAPAEAAILSCYQPFGEYARNQHHGREYRGIRTSRYTYVVDLAGPWLLYDNERDPYQLQNLVIGSQDSLLQARLDKQLLKLLAQYGDAFSPGKDYLQKWGYEVDDTGTVPYSD